MKDSTSMIVATVGALLLAAFGFVWRILEWPHYMLAFIVCVTASVAWIYLCSRLVRRPVFDEEAFDRKMRGE